MMAIRLSRAYTGRKKAMRFFENFHGWADELGAPNFAVVGDQVKVIPMNDLDVLEKELSTKEYAIMFVEGGGAHIGGQIPWDTDFVRALPALAKEYGTILHIDEVATGCRDAVGGWQSLVGIILDLTSMGKVIAGRLGCGALGVKAEIMNMLKPKPAPHRYVDHTGTWNANPLTSAGGVAACTLYLDGKKQERANEICALLRKKGNEIFRKLGISSRLYIATASARLFILSAVHTEKDIDQTLMALSDSLEAMLAEGSLKNA